MSWTKLAPIVKTSGRPMASASIVVNKDQVPKIHLILAATLKDEFGDPKRADVSVGEGENAGSILVEFLDTGAFDVRGFVHGGARIVLPVPDGLPDKPASNAPCVVGAKTRHTGLVCGSDPSPVDSVVLRLPVEAWRRDIAEGIRPPSGGSAIIPPPAAKPSTPVVKPAPADDLVDVVEYLGRKGLKVSRLAGGRFMLGGQTVLMPAVLAEVNKHRAEARLPALTSLQVK